MINFINMNRLRNVVIVINYYKRVKRKENLMTFATNRNVCKNLKQHVLKNWNADISVVELKERKNTCIVYSKIVTNWRRINNQVPIFAIFAGLKVYYKLLVLN